MENKSCLLSKMEELYRKLDKRIDESNRRIRNLEKAQAYYPMTEKAISDIKVGGTD